ncbi:MAG: GAF domain-containing protein [Chloroflexi bacterium]|jgi:GAF domain-containing protein|nr:GAF domain-containing protein [Chloroflexota bacterium]MBT6683059.1 GAF domain-containing protein [Chloroflexota bacterium]
MAVLKDQREVSRELPEDSTPEANTSNEAAYRVAQSRIVGLPGVLLEQSLILVRLLLALGMVLVVVVSDDMRPVWGVWTFVFLAMLIYSGLATAFLATKRPATAIVTGIAGDLLLATVVLPALYFVGSRDNPENLDLLVQPGVAFVKLVIMMATLRLRLWFAITAGIFLVVAPAGLASIVAADGISTGGLWGDVLSFAAVAAVLTVVGQAMQKSRTDLSDQISSTTVQYAEAQRTASEREVLAEIGRIVSQTPDVRDTYERFAEATRKLISADRVSVNFYESDSDLLVTAYVSGQDVSQWEENSAHDPDLTPLSAVVRERRPVVLGSAADSLIPSRPVVDGREAGLKSAVTVPLFHQGALIGTLGLWSSEISSYDQYSVDLLEQIGAQIAPAVDNAKLYSELENEAREREVFAEVSRILSTTPDAPDAYSDFVEQIGRLIRWDRVSVHAFDRTTGRLRNVFAAGKEGILQPAGQDIQPGNFSVSEHVARTGEAILVPDARDLYEEFPDVDNAVRAGLRSAMYVPLIANGTVIGSLAMGADDVNAYKEADLDLLKRLATQVAGAFANTELRTQATRLAMEETALAEIGRIISSSADIDNVYDRFADQVGSLMPADRVSIIEMDWPTNSLSVSYVSGLQGSMPLAGTRRGITRDGVFYSAANSTAGLSIRDLSEARFKYLELESVVASGIRSGLYVPLQSRGEVIGVICVVSQKLADYTASDLELLGRISAQISGAIANARLREQADQLANEEAALAEIGRIVNSSLDIEEIYEQFAEQVRRILKFERIAVTRIGPGEGEYTISHVTGHEVPGLEVGSVWQLDDTPFGPVLRDGKTMFMQDEYPDTDDHNVRGMELSEAAGISSSVVAPLIQQSKPVGFLSIRSMSQNAYDNHDGDLARRIAASVSSAVTNSELFLRSDRQAREEAALGEIGRIITASSKIEDVYVQFSDTLKSLVPADRVTVVEVNPETGELEFGHVSEYPGDAPNLDVNHRLRPNEKMKMVARTGESLFIPDVAEHIADDEALCVVYNYGVRSLIYAPFHDHNRVIGLLCIVSTQPDAHTEDHLRLIERISAQIAGALANAKLQIRSTQQAKEEATLGEIGRIINSSLDIEAIYDQFAEQVQTILPLDRLAIALREPSASSFRVEHLTGTPVPGLTVGTSREIADTNLGPVFENGEILVLQGESSSESRVYVPGASEGLSSSLILPLISRDRVIGFFALRSQVEVAYSDQEITLAQRVATLVSTAISNSDLYERAESQATERAVLAEIGRIVGSSLDIDAVYGRFAEQVGKLIEFDRISISYVNWSLHDAGSKRTERDTQSGFGLGRVIPIGAFVGTRIGRMMRRRRGVVLDEPGIDEFFDKLPWTNESNARSMICVPLVSDGKAIAGLAVSSAKPDMYGDEDLDLVTRVGAQVAGAVENARLHSDLEVASAELEDINKQKTELMTTVAHELRSPLTAFNAFMDLVLDGTAGEVPEKQFKLLVSASRSSVRMQNILDVFSHLEMAEDKSVPLIVTTFDIETLIANALDLLQPAARHSRVEVRFEPSGSLPSIEGDREAINQVISNLVSNAIKYSHESDVVSIRCEANGNDVVISVSDTGFGISAGDQERLFERFYRGTDPAKLRIRGTGLGLYVCKGLVERHDGRLWCESELGRGSTFSFALPIEQTEDVPVFTGSMPTT